MNKNIKRFVIVAIVLVVASLLFVISTKVKKGFSDVQKSFDDDLSPTYSLASKDSEIVVKSSWNKLKVKETMNFRDRSAVSQLIYENKYVLAITKINVKEDDLLKDLVSDTILSTERTVGEVYSIINLTNNFQIQFRSQPVKPASHVFLTLSGDSVTCLKTANSIRYHLLCKDFSVRFEDAAPIDIYASGKEVGITKELVTLDLLLLKRGPQIYVFLMTPIDTGTQISPDLLSSIIRTD
jgi:hypothetical protein